MNRGLSSSLPSATRAEISETERIENVCAVECVNRHSVQNGGRGSTYNTATGNHSLRGVYIGCKDEELRKFDNH